MALAGIAVRSATAPAIAPRIATTALAAVSVDTTPPSVVLLNRAPAARKLSVSWDELRLPPAAERSVYDVIARKAAGSATGSFAATVESHDVAFVILAPK